jgi:hypothetical protein
MIGSAFSESDYRCHSGIDYTTGFGIQFACERETISRASSRLISSWDRNENQYFMRKGWVDRFPICIKVSDTLHLSSTQLIDKYTCTMCRAVILGKLDGNDDEGA